MNLSWRRALAYLLILNLIHQIKSVHITGSWDTSSQRVKIVSKFGFQQVDKLEKANSRGYVYGNVTSQGYDNSTRPVLFALIPESHIGSFYSDSEYAPSCETMMMNITLLAFESRCFTQNKGDYFRWIPCPEGELCKDEDDPSAVLPNYQLTMQVEEPTTAQYWYIVLVACDLSPTCNWTSSTSNNILVDYDLYLTNGKPNSDYASAFTLQFSFDEQDCPEMYWIGLCIYVVLLIVVARSFQVIKQSRPPTRLRLLFWVVLLKTLGIALQSLNVAVFAFDGEGLALARLLGEVFRITSIQLLCLLLILLSRGWGLSIQQDIVSRCCLAVWGVLALSSLVLFFCNFVFVYDALHEIDVFTSWPGYGMLFIRIIYALWFLMEVRGLIMREQNEEKAVFIAHVGAGFLVWFVYLPGLGVIASFISPLWRFKIILGITTFANYTAIACVAHLFWPISSYRKFFQNDLNSHRRMGRSDSHEMQEFEQHLLFDSDDSEPDFPDLDRTNTLHDI